MNCPLLVESALSINCLPGELKTLPGNRATTATLEAGRVDQTARDGDLPSHPIRFEVLPEATARTYGLHRGYG
jgi:hypothetical protein